jgi:hypothetical protein
VDALKEKVRAMIEEARAEMRATPAS